MSIMYFDTAMISSAGGRTYNEDCAAYYEHHGRYCWVLADGLGGHGGGDKAAQTAVEAVLTSFQAYPDIRRDALEAHLAAAQQAVLQAQRQDMRLQRMRTTLVVLLADQECCLWGHAGDSRLYYFRNGALQFQTQDHSVPQALVLAGDIDAAAIRGHEDRNRLLQTLGNADKLKPALTAEPQPLRPGDSFLLCSDGFWEHVLESDMEIDQCKAATPEQWLRIMEQRLLAQIRPGEEHDNYSALAVFAAEA